jgi:hypothetical protein
MSEEKMVEQVQDSLAAQGIEDDVFAAGRLNPRGSSGGLFAGGMIGSDVAGSVGMAAGSLAGMHAPSALSGLPRNMLVGVSATTVYGLAAFAHHDEPRELLFQVSREGLTVKVHQRVNVRVLELIHDDTGSRVELEGNRVPLTHSKDVIEALRG